LRIKGKGQTNIVPKWTKSHAGGMRKEGKKGRNAISPDLRT